MGTQYTESSPESFMESFIVEDGSQQDAIFGACKKFSHSNNYNNT